ncbi:MAG: ABC transporter ATP-binding protein [Hyphomicrobiaceae bacterium]
MLELRDVHSGYGETRVLHGISIDVHAGEVVAVLGRNGVGKTTTLKTVMGLLPCLEGEILLDGRRLDGARPYDIARSGVAYVPETRDIFPSLTVLENLELSLPLGEKRGGGWTLARVFEIFPRLEQRRANGGMQLSGGEQQMLAIARALLLNPSLLVLDEPTEGLAPIVIGEIHSKLAELKRDGLTILLVEQNFGFATSLADRCYVLGKSVVQWSGTSDAILADKDMQHRWLGV